MKHLNHIDLDVGLPVEVHPLTPPKFFPNANGDQMFISAKARLKAAQERKIRVPVRPADRLVDILRG